MREHVRKLFGPLSARLLRLTGESRCGGPLTGLYLGNCANLAFLTRYFFATVDEHPVCGDLNQAGLRTAARTIEDDVDLVLTEQPPFWAWFRPAPSDVTLPAWIRQELRLPEPENEQCPLFPTALEKEVRRLQAHHDYTLRLSAADEHLGRFYHKFYLPYIRARFRDSAVVVPEADFLKTARGSRIARLYSGSQWVAGMLIRRQGAKLRLGWFGCVDGKLFQGASEVLDALCIRNEFEEGVRAVVMGNSRPCLSDGVVRYKGRFGARITATRFPQITIGISVRRWTGPLRDCLRQHPLISTQNGIPSIVRIDDSNERPRLWLEPIDRRQPSGSTRSVP